MFGNSTTSTSAFGQKPAETTSSTPTNILFGKKPAGTTTTPATTSGGLFGSKAATSTTTQSSGSMFGNSTSSTSSNNASTAGGLFAKPAGSTSTTSTAATTTTTPSTGGLFGKSAESTAPSSGGLFGASKKPEDKPAGGLFGASKKPEDKPAGGLFGATSTPATTPATTPASGGLFGAAAKKPEEAAKPAFSFGTTASTKPADSSAKPADGAAKPLFGAAKSADTATKPTEDKPAAAPLFGANPAESNTTTTSASTPLFGTKPAVAGATSTPATTEKKEEAKPAVVVTPAKHLKSAEPTQEETAAYLKNRSIEDIISKWTSVLGNLTKEFQTQASDINSWDKVLMENGDRITQMYTEVVVAERKQTSIDQTLDYINRQQDDVEALLDNYEAQAAEFLSDLAGPDGLQPVDQEREKSYRLAEDLNEKLESMSGNLTNVIKEMNTVQSELANANPDDALTQIVKVLNSHLSSLQWIDSHTTELQEKLDQIQQLESVSHESVESANRVFGSRYRN